MLSKLADLFWKVIGNTKVFRHPGWIVYAPDELKVDGRHVKSVMPVLQPGDVIMRGWRHYLNACLTPGAYSHGGVYIGGDEVMHAVKSGVCRCHVIDFVMADRICVYRPLTGKDRAVELALDFEKRKIPYDYRMTEGKEAMYCFELCAECYRGVARIEKVEPKILGGLVSRKEPAWLSQSFIDSPDFVRVYEYDPDRGVDYYGKN